MNENHPTDTPQETPSDEFVFVIENGGISYLHTDQFRLQRAGRAQVERASNVEFDEAKQKWVAIEEGTGEVIAEDESREECIRQERLYFNEKLKGGLNPFAPRTEAKE